MSLPSRRSGGTCDGFPRVSGDEPWDLLMKHDPVLFSPRERG